MTDNLRIAVIGGGAAGMMAACAAAGAGCAVDLFEHNEKLGKKIYITGKGRCNLTNNCPAEDFFQNVPRNPRFLYSAVYSFDSAAAMDFFESRGLKLKTERGNRVFPVSDHASDVTKALEGRLNDLGASVHLNCEVTRITSKKINDAEGDFYKNCADTKQPAADQAKDKALKGQKKNTCSEMVTGIRYKNPYNGKDTFYGCDAVIIATGGISYPSTGSDGSGYRLCESLGHIVTPLRPSIVGMNVREDYFSRLQGLSLKNIALSFCSGKKRLYTDFGEMLFTHKGISGPLVLSASSLIPDKYFKEGNQITFFIDLKPALDEAQLDARICRDLGENPNRQFKNCLSKLLPAKLIPVVEELSGIDPDKKANSVTRQERKSLLGLLKAFPGTVTSLAGFDEAVVTRGGINVKEVNPSTMESRLVKGLYICGEMLDYDALTGGYNLQAAWSTGHLAGISAASQSPHGN